MGRKRITGDEPDARAKGNGYQREAHREEDSRRGRNKHGDGTKKIQDILSRPSFSSHLATTTMSHADILSEAPSSTLSTALGTAVLEASSYAADSNTGSFATTSDNSQYIKQGRMVYLSVDHTANLKKGTAPLWIWDHREELRHLAGYRPRPQRTGAVVTAVLQSGQLFPSVVIPGAQASIFARSTRSISRVAS